MNIKGHVISSLLILSIFLTSIVGILLIQYVWDRIFFACYAGMFFYMFGVTIPDWDHPKVQEKIVIIRWLKKYTHHRGHWHSIIAATIYASLILLLMIALNVYYWYVPTISGFCGYISHLVEDDLNRPWLKHKPKRGVKVW